MTHKTFALAFAVSLIVMMVLSVAAPMASAIPKVTIKFEAAGFSGYSSNIITIDGTTYTISDLGWRTFNWKPGETHTIQAFSSFRNTDYPSKNYTFSSWTNAGGLTDASGTYTVPNHDTTVTMNYILVTHTAAFSFNGITQYSSQIVIIDGVTYPLSDFTWRTFAWDYGTVHTVQAISPIKNTEYPPKTFAFQSWTDGGSDLTSVSGTVTMPNNDISITANYGSPTHIAAFAINGLSGYTSSILIIDGTTYAVSNLATQIFAWDAGTTHTVQAIHTVKNTDSPAKYYNFTSWTNGNGLVNDSGTFTMPSEDVAVTANYVQSSAHVSFATNGLNNILAEAKILTIDGQDYDIYAVPNINNVSPQWNITSTHTITAASTVTGWDSVTYYFQGWTNGNGLITNTGTIITPAADVIVTANYGTAPSTTQSATAITIICNPMAENRVTSITGLLSSESSGVSGKTVELFYFDGVIWVSIASVNTAADGNYTYAWTIPASLENGQYPVKALFAGDSSYLTCTASTGSPGNGANLTVLPESTLGSIVALLACFAGALAFFRLRTKRGHSKTV